MRHLTTAETAKAIRQRFKAMGIRPISVRSRTFANGSSVDIHLKAEDFDKHGDSAYWRGFERDFTYGSFDGMTDSYNYVPTTIVFDGELCEVGAKYVTVYRG